MKVTSITITLFYADGHHQVTASKGPFRWSVRLDNRLVCETDEINIDDICQQFGLPTADINKILC